MWTVEESLRTPRTWTICWNRSWGTGYEWHDKALAEAACQALNEAREQDEAASERAA